MIVTVTMTCGVCARPHVASINAVDRRRPCPFCGAHVEHVKQGAPHTMACDDCGEQLARPAARCGWCQEQHEVLT